MNVLPMRAVTVQQLAEWVRMVEDCYYHDLDGYGVVHEHVDEVLHQLDVPKEWKTVVRVMADGAHYYGEGIWMAKYVGHHREEWMSQEFWDQN
jgi:hypothetical protein